MHPKIFDAFDNLLAPLSLKGAVLEIGASPRHRSLLSLSSLAGASLRIGVGMDGPARTDSYQIIAGDAHRLDMFADGAFDLVVCNATLEHDPRFWLLLVEARRVVASGGWLAFGVPAYGPMGSVPGARVFQRLARLPWLGNRFRVVVEALNASSATLGEHDFPGDYYRFSEQAMAAVILDGLERIQTRMIMTPPRVVGLGRKP